MGAVVAVAAGARRPDVRMLLRRRPELGASVVIVGAWVALVALTASGAPGDPAHAGAGSTPWTPWLCRLATSPPADGLGGGSAVATGLPNWTLMTVAMMGPPALGGIRHTGINSLRWRRKRAMAEFAAAYLAVWTAFGALVLVAAGLMPRLSGPLALGVVLTVATMWQLTPLKRRSLRECHRAVPLPPRGWRAEAGALRFGLRTGGACLGSCWCLMLVMAVSPGAHLLWTATLAGVVTTERLSERPRRTMRLSTAALAIAALASFAALVLP